MSAGRRGAVNYVRESRKGVRGSATSQGWRVGL